MLNSFVSGPLCTFTIGKDEKKMTVHLDLLLKHSDYFRSMMSGTWKEAQTHKVRWEDVDEATFEHLAAFLYIGDYAPPSTDRRSTTGPIQAATSRRESPPPEFPRLFQGLRGEVDEDGLPTPVYSPVPFFSKTNTRLNLREMAKHLAPSLCFGTRTSCK